MKALDLVKSFSDKFNLLLSNTSNTYESSLDTLAAQQLSSLRNNLHYLPHTESSLRYHSIQIFLNDIIINKRKVIVEFGSGLSTIYLVKLVEQLKQDDITIISIDNNRAWLDIIYTYIQGLDVNVHLLYAETVKNNIELKNNEWYNIDKLDLLDKYKGKIDSVLIDGPEAWYDEISLSRYPALPFIYELLAPSCSIFLDDTNRNGEQEVLKLWRANYKFNEQKLNYNFTRLHRGSSFNIL